MTNNLSIANRPVTSETLHTARETEVKMFHSNNPSEVETEVNHWLQQNEVNVQHIGQSQSEKNGKFVFVLSVFYQKINSN
jgi:hypothetical protein